MGNIGSSGGANGDRRRRGSGRHSSHGPIPPHPPSAHPQFSASPNPSQPEISGNRYVFAAATPYPPHYPNPNAPLYYQYPGYHPPPPPAFSVPLPAPFDHHHRGGSSGPPLPHGHHAPHLNWVGPYMPPPPPPHQHAFPFVKHQKALTIRNDVNLKKETLRMEPDEHNPGNFLVAFTFDATVTGSITIFFFAREGFDCSPTSMDAASLPKPFTVAFKEGLGQRFRQPPGSGINFSMFEEAELLLKAGETEVYPLAVKAEASPPGEQHHQGRKAHVRNSLITQAAFEKKDNGGYQVRVIKQILWVDDTRYELQEIYGIGNSVDGDFDGNDPGKECVICLSEPRDTTVLPCRHMCMCSECAKVLGFQTNRCPICRQPIKQLLEIKINSACHTPPDEQPQKQGSPPPHLPC